MSNLLRKYLNILSEAIYNPNHTNVRKTDHEMLDKIDSFGNGGLTIAQMRKQKELAAQKAAKSNKDNAAKANQFSLGIIKLDREAVEAYIETRDPQIAFQSCRIALRRSNPKQIAKVQSNQQWQNLAIAIFDKAADLASGNKTVRIGAKNPTSANTLNSNMIRLVWDIVNR